MRSENSLFTIKAEKEGNPMATEIRSRVGNATRITGEVKIEVEIRLDEPGESQILISADKEEPGLGFSVLSMFIHLFSQIYRHGKIGGYIKAHGDFPHHLLEDLGLCWGEALSKALGDKGGVERFWSLAVPLDGSRSSVEIDLSGRGWVNLNLQDISDPELAGLIQHMFEWIAANGKFNLTGKTETLTLQSNHHQLEALAKAFGRALHHASTITDQSKQVPSTKGILDK